MSMTRILKSRWIHDCGEGAVIWHLAFTPSGTLVGQKRFAEDRQALFFTIDPLSGSVYVAGWVAVDPVQGAVIGEGWFAGIETVHQQLVYIHSWQDASPEHRGIWAFDPVKGEVRWSRPEFVFSANTPGGLLVYRIVFFAGLPERRYALLDPLRGTLVEGGDIAAEEALLLQRGAETEEQRQGVLLPEMDPQSGGGREWMLLEGICVEGLHRTDRDGGWQSSLRIVESGTLLYEDAMESGSSKPLWNNFLVRGGDLYYIRNKRELVCVPLR
ncbi:DUF4905 domain-containing protein [Chlorobium phaeovibrioides]|uniref:DUF4905 domain-containing protein n=1 Tax=Chlorobium phaeovibrioides TaxID=1094 RepID=A0A432AWZ8_CHLPH|nr:DUF4905 domain-containing protein [Chlorobium phaeovibrioides]RTY39176.1 DUF4905 domain-containing protein [Chlorobium phaeovibrioides]